MARHFNRDDVSALLAQCHRRCCICHRFCGSKIETDHIIPAAEGGGHSIDNAIPVCFECHADIHSYNDKHPRGRKYQPDELKRHKEQWIGICTQRPEVFVTGSWQVDVGPLQALIDELEFNRTVAELELSRCKDELGGAVFRESQFVRAIAAGAIAVLQDRLRSSILAAYAQLVRTNELRIGALGQDTRSRGETGTHKLAREALERSLPAINNALGLLLEFLSTEEGQSGQMED